MGNIQLMEKLKHFVDKMYKPKGSGIELRFFSYKRYQKLFKQLENEIQIAKQINKYIFEQYEVNEELAYQAIISKLSNKECIQNAKYFTKENINSLEERILSKGKLEEICLLAKTGLANTKLLQEKILESQNPYWIYQFAIHVEDADITLIEEALIKINNTKYLYLLAKNFKSKDPEKINYSKIEKNIMNSNNINWMEKYALNVKGLSQGEFMDYITNNYTTAKIVWYSKNKQDLNVSYIKQLEKSVNAQRIYEFALEKNEEANIAVLEEEIINTGNSHYILLFAKHVDWSNPHILGEALMKLEDYEAMAEFAISVEGADTEMLANKVIDSNNPKAILKLSSRAPIEILQRCEKALSKFEDDTYLRKFYSMHRLTMSTETIEKKKK